MISKIIELFDFELNKEIICFNNKEINKNNLFEINKNDVLFVECKYKCIEKKAMYYKNNKLMTLNLNTKSEKVKKEIIEIISSKKIIVTHGDYSFYEFVSSYRDYLRSDIFNIDLLKFYSMIFNPHEFYCKRNDNFDFKRYNLYLEYRKTDNRYLKLEFVFSYINPFFEKLDFDFQKTKDRLISLEYIFNYFYENLNYYDFKTAFLNENNEDYIKYFDIYIESEKLKNIIVDNKKEEKKEEENMIRYFKYIAESTDLLNRTNRSELDIFFRMSKTDQELFERLIDHFSSVLYSIVGKENMNDRILKIIYELSALKAYDIIKEEEDIK